MSEPQFTANVQVSAPERASIVKEFEWAVTEIGKVVDELTARLTPILRPTEPSDSLPQLISDEVSEARSRLHDLHRVTAYLRTTLERLEV